jgi:hypothetical protein
MKMSLSGIELHELKKMARFMGADVANDWVVSTIF